MNNYKYWDIEFKRENSLKDENEYKEAIIFELEQSVRRRMDMDVEYGSYLSGGIDSSLVSAILVNQGAKNLKTFTLSYESDFLHKQEDTKFARIMANKLGTEHYEYVLTANEVWKELPNVLKSFDEPFSGVISTYFITKFIAQHVKVAMSGDGADELFGSYLTHRLSSPIQYLHQFSNIPKFDALTTKDKSILRPFDSEIEYNKLIKLYDKQNFIWRNKLLVFSREDISKLFNGEIDVIPFKETLNIDGKTELDLTLESEFKDQLPNQVLAFVDRLSMVHSVEVRCPFLDYKFIEMVAKIPSHLKIKNGDVKFILKQAALKYLPNDLVNRKKEGFVMPVYKWMESIWYKNVRDIILDSDIFHDFDMNKNYMEQLLNELKQGKNHFAKIWNIFNLVIWYNNL